MQFNLTPIVKALLLINVGVFALQFVGVNIADLFGLRYPTSSQFLPHQFLTYMFTQVSLGHLFSNMFGLFIFGPMLERFWGSQRFLLFYVVTGIGGSLLYSGINAYQVQSLQQGTEAYVQSPTPAHLRKYVREYAANELAPQSRTWIERFANQYEDQPNDPNLRKESVEYVKEIYQVIYRGIIDNKMIGASGAIFGILMAFGLLFPNTELFLLFIPFPIKAKYFVALYGIYELYAGVRQNPGDNVAHFAHLGGMLFAFILIRYWGNQRNKFY